jgi:hypothetical protein
MEQIFRAYIVWRSCRVIAIPVLLYLALIGKSSYLLGGSIINCHAVSSGGSIYILASSKPSQAYDIFQGSTGIWIKLHLAATLTCNFLSTCKLLLLSPVRFIASALTHNTTNSGILAFKLWMIERNVSDIREDPQSSLMPVLRVVVDSGLLYSIALISALICFATESRAEYFVYDIVSSGFPFFVLVLRTRFTDNPNHQHILLCSHPPHRASELK